MKGKEHTVVFRRPDFEMKYVKGLLSKAEDKQQKKVYDQQICLNMFYTF